MLAAIEADLADFGVTFDRWYSEKALVDAFIDEARLAAFLQQPQGLDLGVAEHRYLTARCCVQADKNLGG